jgi:hypothetical protein
MNHHTNFQAGRLAIFCFCVNFFCDCIKSFDRKGTVAPRADRTLPLLRLGDEPSPDGPEAATRVNKDEDSEAQ